MVATIKTSRSFGWWAITIVFVLAMHDVLVGYLARSFGVAWLARPWLVLSLVLVPLLLLNLRELVRAPRWALLAMAGLIAGLTVGVFSIQIPGSLVPQGLAKMSLSDIVAMSLAFALGVIWVGRQGADAKWPADVLLGASIVHAAVCLAALSGAAPDAFPIIDSPYWRDGRWVSRPEITTDQTRQVLYFIPALAVVFIRSGVVRLTLALLTAVVAAYVVFQVQSRGGLLIMALFVPMACALGVRYRVQRPMLTAVVAVVLAIGVLTQVDRIAAAAADTLWRFDQLDQGYGGRLVSIAYLFEKVVDPGFWVPRGYSEFLAAYGNAPHSFPTMVFLMGGILSLITYVPLVVLPLWVLGRRVIRRGASGVERLAFFLGSVSLAVQLTQPVIAHEFFWLMLGVTIGALGVRVPRQVSGVASSIDGQLGAAARDYGPNKVAPVSGPRPVG